MHVDSERAEHSWHVGNISAGSILSLVLFTVFVNSLDNEVECTLSKFANDMKLGWGGD